MKQLLMIGLIRSLELWTRSNSGSPRRILVPAYTGLGNFIMMTPMIASIRDVWPHASVDVITDGKFGTDQVLSDTGLVEHTWVLAPETGMVQRLAFFWKLRQQKYDLALVPFDASPVEYRLGIVLAGIGRRVGHDTALVGSPMSWTRAAITDLVPLQPSRHESDLHFDLLQVLVPELRRRYESRVNVADRASVQARFELAGKQYVVLQVGAANAQPSPKRWPIERFGTLARHLADQGWTVVVVGDAAERAFAEQFAAPLKPAVVNTAGETTIAELAALIKDAAALICHDSGAMHIGNAVGTPLIALYGPTDEKYTAPLAPSSRILRNAGIACAPCMANFAKTEAEVIRDCRIDFACMRSIEAATVARQLAEILSPAASDALTVLP